MGKTSVEWDVGNRGEIMVSQKQAMTWGVFILAAMAAVYIGGQFNLIPQAGVPAAEGAMPTAPAALTSCQLSGAQTMSIGVYDVDNPGSAVATPSSAVFMAEGGIYSGNTTTVPGGSYKILTTKANYAGTFKVYENGAAHDSLTTGCVVTVPVKQYMKAIDTSAGATVYNTDGITANSVANNLSIGSGGSGTAHVKLTQSASYKHIAGEKNQFVVYINATNVTDWNPAQMSATFDNAACKVLSQGGLDNTAVPAAMTAVFVQGFVCDGDFLANDGAVHDLAIKIVAANGVNPTDQAMSVNFAAADYYQNTIDSSKVEYGGVKDSGAAIQTLQTAAVYVG